MYYRFSLFLSLLTLMACNSGSSDPFAKCAQGRPVAIFSDTLKDVSTHHFGIKEKAGIEQLAFTNGVQLEVFQSGCDLVKQEFRFRLPGKSPGDAANFWVDQAINIFRFLGGLSEEHTAFGLWAGAIEEQAAQIQLGQEHLLGGNFFVKIDKIRSPESSLLLVDFFQK